MSKFITEGNHEDAALIVCGDFNSLPESSSISLICDEKEFEKSKYHDEVSGSWFDKIWAKYDED